MGADARRARRAAILSSANASTDEPSTADADAIVVGAGPAGLACGAALSRRGLKTLILEKGDAVGAVWRRHYDRLHLHTDRDHSALPGWPMPRSYPRYPARAQVVEYLERYAQHFGLQPVFHSDVKRVRRNDAHWQVETSTDTRAAPLVIIATGWADTPYTPRFPGMDDYRGRMLHSSVYRNPSPHAGQRVLVVGLGNSGGEIALDLAEADIDVTLAVRGPVKILPRELLGLPVITWAIAQRWLPPGVADFLDAPLLRLAVGSLRDTGLTELRKGPLRMIAEDHRVPMLDVGTLARIRDGSIKVRDGIDHFTADGVVFASGAAEPFDAVIFATGFRPDMRGLLPDAPELFDGQGLPRVTGKPTSQPGLFFCGQIVIASGQFRAIGIEAEQIGRLAAKYLLH
jgi:cation diffusion facilitator CzcD-associated flavoprotein CzcO